MPTETTFTFKTELNDWRTLATPDLKRGDIVSSHGLALLLDTAPRLSYSHPGSRTYAFDALVLNRDAVSDDQVPYSYTATATAEHRWSVQGNGRAYWSVFRPVPR